MLFEKAFDAGGRAALRCRSSGHVGVRCLDAKVPALRARLAEAVVDRRWWGAVFGREVWAGAEFV
ncbi:hypothetical protein, partial [Gordonia sp. (in: high G+C Gram-positive bacteria)]|uniref:hypothetical protein n=1 Tax=Gordonia sp. (in: high G+C Gram-positive bacteria) TaxID=84139 RepID=UPI002634D442